MGSVLDGLVQLRMMTEPQQGRRTPICSRWYFFRSAAGVGATRLYLQRQDLQGLDQLSVAAGQAR